MRFNTAARDGRCKERDSREASRRSGERLAESRPARLGSAPGYSTSVLTTRAFLAASAHCVSIAWKAMLAGASQDSASSPASVEITYNDSAPRLVGCQV